MAKTAQAAGGPPEGPLGTVEVWGAGRLLLGVDEAGRGPLAGPVVAAAVALPPGPLPSSLQGLDDSKKLTERRRQLLTPHIARQALAVGVGRISARRIDEINILEATREAMRRAVWIATARLSAQGLTPEALLVDGHLPLPGHEGEQWALKKGDGRSYNIAAASVIAKTVRDRHMEILAKRYPGYGLEVHKGYGTKAHRAALQQLGNSAIHRQTFKWKPVS
ncbi:MAG: ribonuclease HII [Bradymonadia bacterium]